MEQHVESGEAAGPLMFARYAYPPNERGYCGPDDHQSLFEYAASGRVDGGLRRLALSFNGAWPYLELIAAAAGIGDPLNVRVVEAYWIGNDLLDRIDMSTFGDSLQERFRARAGRTWGYLAESIPVGAVPHHAFHVFGVYPWVGLLGSDRAEHPLHILDRCRIRWGEVVSVDGDQVVVTSRRLVWDGKQLDLSEPQPETVVRGLDGLGLVGELAPGDAVALHWDWVCDRLSPRRLQLLQTHHHRQLDLTNHQLAHPGPAMLLG